VRLRHRASCTSTGHALSLLAALIAAQLLLNDLLTRLLITGWNGYKPWTPLLIAVLLIAVWRWHERIALVDKSANADGPRGGDLRRGYWFIIAAFGLVMTIGALMTFVSTVFSWLGNPIRCAALVGGISSFRR